MLEPAYRSPYDLGAAFRLYAAHAVPGLESVDEEARRFSFLLELASGPVWVQLDLTDPIRVRLASTDPAVVQETTAVIRRMLDLDGDPDAVARTLRRQPLIAPLLLTRPGLRVTGYPNPHQAAIQTVIGQQVSLAAARTFTGRLVAAYGSPGPDGLLRFPPPEHLAGLDPVALQHAVGLTGVRARTVVAMSAAFASGLRLSAAQDPVQDRAETRAQLLAIPGVGPWTADCLAVRVLGDRDAFPAGDLVLRRALGVRTPREAAAAVEACRPYRSYALVYLWLHAGFG